jgi:Zn-dependent oligopeptidase
MVIIIDMEMHQLEDREEKTDICEVTTAVLEALHPTH